MIKHLIEASRGLKISPDRQGTLTVYAIIFTTFLSVVLFYEISVFNNKIDNYNKIISFYQIKTNENYKNSNFKEKNSQSDKNK